MKKIVPIFLTSALLYWAHKSAFSTSSRSHTPTTIVNELTFVEIVRDLELLNSWLLNNYYSQETIPVLREENHKKILALYGVDPQAFKESLKYYLEDSSERALKVYRKVYLALEAFSI